MTIMFNRALSKVRTKMIPALRDRSKTIILDAMPDEVIEISPPPTKMSGLFEAQWLRTKAALLEGRDLLINKDGSPNTNKKQVMDTVFENTRRGFIAIAEHCGHNQANNVAILGKIILPVIRHAVPSMISNDIIGVQALSNAVGNIFVLRRTRDSIVILKEEIEARTRKLAIRWMFEAAQDAQAHLGVDIEAEIMAALVLEVVSEFDQQVLQHLRTMAQDTSETSDLFDSNRDTDATFIGDHYNEFRKLILKQAADIGVRTNSSGANWCVVPSSILPVLKSLPDTVFVPADDSHKNDFSVTKFVGKLDGLNVYCDHYARDLSPVLVGRKGSEIDAAAILSPYVPLTSSGVIIDPQTFEPVLSFLTRYGYYVPQATDPYLNQGSDYVGLVKTGEDLTFI